MNVKAATEVPITPGKANLCRPVGTYLLKSYTCLPPDSLQGPTLAFINSLQPQLTCGYCTRQAHYIPNCPLVFNQSYCGGCFGPSFSQSAPQCQFDTAPLNSRVPFSVIQPPLYTNPSCNLSQCRSHISVNIWSTNLNLNGNQISPKLPPSEANTLLNCDHPISPTNAPSAPSTPEYNIVLPQSFDKFNDRGQEPKLKPKADNVRTGMFNRPNNQNSGASTPCNFSLIKGIMYQYFFEDALSIPNRSPNPLELSALKVLLLKKLVHDKKKSRMFYMIRNLTNDALFEFLENNPALNRKNIIKSNIFKRVWKALEKRENGRFVDHYFSEFFHRFPRETFSIKHYRKNHSFNLSDEFYARCLASKSFRADFFEVLADAKFRDSLLQHSKRKFMSSFDYWMSETMIFLHKGMSPFDRQNKLPDFKYGTSFKDLELAASLFKRLSQED